MKIFRTIIKVCTECNLMCTCHEKVLDNIACMHLVFCCLSMLQHSRVVVVVSFLILVVNTRWSITFLVTTRLPLHSRYRIHVSVSEPCISNLDELEMEKFYRVLCLYSSYAQVINIAIYKFLLHCMWYMSCPEKIVLKLQLTLPLLLTTCYIRDRDLNGNYHEVYDTNHVAQHICVL